MWRSKSAALSTLNCISRLQSRNASLQSLSTAHSAFRQPGFWEFDHPSRAYSADAYWQNPSPRTVEKLSAPKRRRPETYVSQHYRLEPGDVEGFLRRHRWKFRCTGEHAIVEECPFCHDTKRSQDNMWKLHILRVSGVYYCHRCKAKGTWFDLRRRLGYEAEFQNPFSGDVSRSEGVISPKSSSVPDKAIQEQFVRDLWGVHKAVRRYLNKDRGLSDDALLKYGVGAARFSVMVEGVWQQQLCITFPMYDGNGRLVRHKVRSIERKSGMRLEPKGGGWGLFGLDIVSADADEVIITEGEIDALSVYQATGRPAVSLPNGASSLPIAILPYLERFKRVVLWMDNDGPGQDGAKQFSKKLGMQRCLSVRDVRGEDGTGSEHCKDANDALRQQRDLAVMIKRATAVPHEGLLTFSDIREEVRHEIENKDSIRGMQCLSLPRFNELLKGHRRGELSVYSGHTGVGKTTLLSQLALDLCMQGIPTLWGSFEIGNPRLVSRILRQFYGAHYSGPTNTPDLLEDFDTWADRFGELPMYFMRYHGSNAIDRVVEAMEYANYVYDCSHVVLDNLQFMTSGQGFGKDKFAVLDHAVGQIREFCTAKNVHVSLVVHPRKEDDEVKIQTSSIFGSAKATQEADNVVILQQGPILDVRKNRYDGTLGAVSLHFDRKRLLFSQKDNDGASWAGRMLVAKPARSAIRDESKQQSERPSEVVQKQSEDDLSRELQTKQPTPKRKKRQKQSTDSPGALGEGKRSDKLWNRKTAGTRKARAEQYGGGSAD